MEIRDPSSARGRDLHCAFVGEIRPNPPRAFPLLKPDNRRGGIFASASEMQNQVLAATLCVCEVIKIYDAAIRRANKIHGKHQLPDLA
jgi:hypothetical protein